VNQLPPEVPFFSLFEYSAKGEFFYESIPRVFLAGLIFVLAGSAFAKNDKEKVGTGEGGKAGKGGETYAAPEFHFSGSLKYELLVIAGGGVLLLERPRRRRQSLLNK
jgi:hypothetical protein